MRILVFFKTSLLRHFDTTLAALADAGHEVILASPYGGDDKIPTALRGRPGIRVVLDESEGARDPVQGLWREARNYLRYLDPRLEQGWANRQRAWRWFVRAFSGGTRPVSEAPWLALGDVERQNLERVLEGVEGYFPPDPQAVEFLGRIAPDVVLVTPLVAHGAPGTDVVKAARRLGIPSGLLVFSWDNLSNKGAMHARPDRVYVWNDRQAAEAIELHGVPEAHVVVTGAPRFDEFFELQPRTGPASYREELGLPADRHLILYLGSSPFVAPNEAEILARWNDARLASHDSVVRDALVVVRPHPRNRKTWVEHPFEPATGVTVDERSSIYLLQRFRDQIDAADIVVGLNTSGQIEAAIGGRPVYTYEASEGAPGQLGSTHFYYLLQENGGFVEHATTLDEHFAQLGRGLRGEYDPKAITDFVTSFVRPRGLDTPATQILADEIVRLADLEIERPAAAAEPAAPTTNGRTAFAPGEPSDIARLSYPSGEIVLRATSPAERKRFGSWSWDRTMALEWIEANVGPDDVLYDLGAGVGALALVAAQRTTGLGSVVAFEPSGPNFGRLCENLALNGLSDVVAPLPLLLSSATRLQTLTHRTLDPGDGWHKVGLKPRFAKAKRQRTGPGRHYLRQTVLATTLDDAMARFDLPAPTLLKLTAHGNELDVVAGAQRALRSPLLRGILVTSQDVLADAMGEALSRFGFALRTEDVAPHGGKRRLWCAHFTADRRGGRIAGRERLRTALRR